MHRSGRTPSERAPFHRLSIVKELPVPVILALGRFNSCLSQHQHGQCTFTGLVVSILVPYLNGTDLK